MNSVSVYRIYNTFHAVTYISKDAVFKLTLTNIVGIVVSIIAIILSIRNHKKARFKQSVTISLVAILICAVISLLK